MNIGVLSPETGVSGNGRILLNAIDGIHRARSFIRLIGILLEVIV